LLTAKIVARFPLAEAATALKMSETSGRTAVGKIILVP
jgi:NADPH2:quinone reductase